MNDLTSQINQILGNPEMMEQIKNLSGLFGQSADTKENGNDASNYNNTSPNQSAIANNSQNAFDLLGAEGLQTAMKFIPLINELKQDDDTIKLLRAIKPFLSPRRQEKLEEAVKILRIIRVIPYLKNQGIMNFF
ncbi:MAG: hypothetical protein II685_08300 [Clostridia bacterium]|nr:hypothetical protein [Ruminococcus sp.]MBQ3970464.1 hypothetical protein [Clostridia bacterium]